MSASPPRRVAVAASVVASHPLLRAEIVARYPDVRFNDSGRRLAGGELIALLDGCDGAIVSLETIDEALLDAVPTLRVIGKYGVGLDRIDVAALSRRGIRLGWAGGTNARAVAELALGLILACLRSIPEMNAELRAGRWSPRRGRNLQDRCIGLIGCGHIGQALARMLRALGCRVIVHDRRPLEDFRAEVGTEPVDLDTLLATADIVSLHLPRTNETVGLLDAERIGRMKHGAILINTARGDLVDTEALKRALREGRIASAAADVFDPEPPVDAELLAMPGFVGTPHIGGSTEEAVLACGRVAIAGLEETRLPEEFIPPYSYGRTGREAC